MSEYRFDTIVSLNPDQLAQENVLWIWYADKIPPHIGISVKGNYYSLKFNGKDLGLTLDKPLKVIHDRKILTLFVSLDNSLQCDSVNQVFSKYEKASSDGVTCLDPIQKILEYSDCDTIFDLLDRLNASDLIKSVAGIYLTENFTGIPRYGKNEIRNRLINLENASVGKHISTLG